MKPLVVTAALIVIGSVAVSVLHQTFPDRRGGRMSSVSASEKLSGASGTPVPPVPVIVELFTSEGCSSCPPADALLTQLENEQPIPGVEVLALEEHVDYWDGLGWVDPFSKYELTMRQQRYGDAFGGNAYTPQMVVDGQFEFVGSRGSQARAAIASAASGVHSEITLQRAPIDADGHSEWPVNVTHLSPAAGTAAGDDAEVWLAVTETHLHTDVERGENAGENLHHAAVVRQLTKLGVADAGKAQPFSSVAKLSLHPEWKKENLRVVVFLQQKKSRRILGAASLKVLE